MPVMMMPTMWHLTDAAMEEKSTSTEGRWPLTLSSGLAGERIAGAHADHPGLQVRRGDEGQTRMDLIAR